MSLITIELTLDVSNINNPQNGLEVAKILKKLANDIEYNLQPIQKIIDNNEHVVGIMMYYPGIHLDKLNF